MLTSSVVNMQLFNLFAFLHQLFTGSHQIVSSEGCFHYLAWAFPMTDAISLWLIIYSRLFLQFDLSCYFDPKY